MAFVTADVVASPGVSVASVSGGGGATATTAHELGQHHGVLAIAAMTAVEAALSPRYDARQQG